MPPPSAATSRSNPCSANCLASSSPMPLDAPVTTANLSAIECLLVGTPDGARGGGGESSGSREQVDDPNVLRQQLREAGRITIDVGPAEVAAGGVGDHVRAPGRVGGEADAVLRLVGRNQVPALDVRLRLLVRGAVLVDHQRRIEPDGPERLGGLRDALAEVWADFDAVLAQDVVRRGPRLLAEEILARLGDALAEHGLRRRHE